MRSHGLESSRSGPYNSQVRGSSSSGSRGGQKRFHPRWQRGSWRIWKDVSRSTTSERPRHIYVSGAFVRLFTFSSSKIKLPLEWCGLGSGSKGSFILFYFLFFPTFRLETIRLFEYFLARLVFCPIPVGLPHLETARLRPRPARPSPPP